MRIFACTPVSRPGSTGRRSLVLSAFALAGILGLGAPQAPAGTITWGAYVQGGIHNPDCYTTDGSINFPVDNNAICLFDGTNPSVTYGKSYLTSVGSASGSIPGDDSGSVSASADLFSGDLHAYAKSTTGTSTFSDPRQAGSIAGIFDTVQFQGVSAGQSVIVHMSGTASYSGDVQGAATLLLQPGALDAYYFAVTDTFVNCDGCSGTVAWDRSFTLNNVVNGADYSFVALVTALAANNNHPGTIDAHDPISFDLPTGVTMTSNSDLLLGDPPSSVPEPPTIALFGIGLAVADLLRRRATG